jgi:hypothetical protein
MCINKSGHRPHYRKELRGKTKEERYSLFSLLSPLFSLLSPLFSLYAGIPGFASGNGKCN